MITSESWADHLADFKDGCAIAIGLLSSGPALAWIWALIEALVDNDTPDTTVDLFIGGWIGSIILCMIVTRLLRYPFLKLICKAYWIGSVVSGASLAYVSAVKFVFF